MTGTGRPAGYLPTKLGHVRSVVRLVMLAGLVGAVAGLGAVTFQLLCHVVVHYGLEQLAGFYPGRPAGEGWFFGPEQPVTQAFSPWLLLAVITAGGLVSGLLVYGLAPEAEGHGTDAAIRAYHHRRGLIRPRVPLVKILASAVTIGSGGSGGREGPVAQIGAGFGSFLGTRLGLSESERRLLLAAGMGAGIAAIFRAPLAGAIFAIEVLYRDEDFEAEALVPSFIACTMAYCVYGLVMQQILGVGPVFQHIFAIMPGLRFDNPLLLLPLAALAAAMVVAATLYVRVFYGLHGVFRRLRVPPHFRPAIGALLTGVLALVAFYGAGWLGTDAQNDTLDVLSFGYGILQRVLDGSMSHAPAVAAAVLLIVGLGKIFTTSLTIGSGGSGGVFGPSMVIGGTLGGAVGLAFNLASPSLVTRIDVFVILGMAAFFSAAAKTPVSTIIIVSELTGGYELLLPAMWVSALAYLLSSKRYAIYREQVPSRLESPAHKDEFIVDVLKGMTVGGIGKHQTTDFVTVPATTSLLAITELIPRTTQTVFPVTDECGRFCGIFDLSDVRRFLYKQQMGQVIIAQDILVNYVAPLRLDSDLSAVMGQFAKVKYDELPVVGPDGSQVIGMLRRGEVLSAYHERLPQERATEG